MNQGPCCAILLPETIYPDILLFLYQEEVKSQALLSHFTLGIAHLDDMCIYRPLRVQILVNP